MTKGNESAIIKHEEQINFLLELPKSKLDLTLPYISRCDYPKLLGYLDWVPGDTESNQATELRLKPIYVNHFKAYKHSDIIWPYEYIKVRKALVKYIKEHFFEDIYPSPCDPLIIKTGDD